MYELNNGEIDAVNGGSTPTWPTGPEGPFPGGGGTGPYNPLPEQLPGM
jgi:hypothetical protein